jgi:hypothetical protein
METFWKLLETPGNEFRARLNTSDVFLSGGGVAWWGGVVEWWMGEGSGVVGGVVGMWGVVGWWGLGEGWCGGLGGVLAHVTAYVAHV